MTTQELQDIVLRSNSDISEIRRQLSELASKEERVETALQRLRARLHDLLKAFDRDAYKSTDWRLRIRALASEILIFARLGYDIGIPGAEFLLGVDALLGGMNQAALDHFKVFLDSALPSDRNIRNAHYLSGMIQYNRRDYPGASEAFAAAFRYSEADVPDWQSLIYVGEISFFQRRPVDDTERAFFNVEDRLKGTLVGLHDRNLATLYLKFGNCYVETFRDPAQANPMRNNSVAVEYYKKARKCFPAIDMLRRSVSADVDARPVAASSLISGDLLPIVIDHSLAQALLVANSVDMGIAQTPEKLFEDVFHRLRKVVLLKREEIILAQCYFMLGTCTVFSRHLSKDAGEIYLEYARHQTLNVPSDVCFYSCITKELLARDSFVEQIEFYAQELERQIARR